MKFFTLEWATGQLSDDGFERRHLSYQAHLETIKSKLTPALSTLVSKINIHDGLIQEISAEQGRGELTIDFVCGDRQVGYFDLRIVYLGVDWAVVNLDLLIRLASNEAEALYDEVHLGPSNTFEHHILFEPHSLVIRFSDLSFSCTPRSNPSDRSLKELANRFLVKP